MVGELQVWDIALVVVATEEELLSSLAVAKGRKRCMFRLFVVVWVGGERLLVPATGVSAKKIATRHRVVDSGPRLFGPPFDPPPKGTSPAVGLAGV